MGARSITAVGMAVATLGSLAAPTQVAAEGIRVGPLETVCVAVPDDLDAAVGDVVIASVTVADPSAPGHVVAHGAHNTPAGSSSVNFPARATVPNLVAAAVDDHGSVCVTSGWSATAHVLVDAVGVISSERITGAGQATRRVLDTRDPGNPHTSGAPVAPGTTVCTDHAAAGATIANVTVTGASGPGHLTVHPESASTPGATSTHNFVADQTVANLTVTPGGASRLCATNSQHSSVHVIFDVVAELDGDAFVAPPSGAARLLDTRDGDGPTGGAPVAASQTVCVAIDGADAGDVALVNAAIVEPAELGFATVHPRGADPTATSTHNFAPQQTVANLTATTLAEDREVCATPSRHGSAHVVLDLIGHIDGTAFRQIGAAAARLLDTREVDVLPGPVGDPRLTFGHSCDELRDIFAAHEHLRIATQYGTDPTRRPYDFDSPGHGPLFPPAIPATSGDPGADAPAFSDTNTQVAGIDEGDVVETDGRYVYGVVRPLTPPAVGTELSVTDLTAADTVARVPLPLFAPELILWGSHLLVTGHLYVDSTPHTGVLVFDVSDPANPVELASATLEGEVRAVRSIDGNVRLVVAASTWPALPRSVETTVADLHAAIDELPATAWLPRRAPGVTQDPDWSPALDCTAVATPAVGWANAVAYIAEVQLDANAAAVTTSAGVALAGSAYSTTVSASRNMLYLSVERHLPWWSLIDSWVPWNESTPTTTLHAFELSSDAPATYAASHELPGYLLNQFAIGEHDGVVRVAVTSGWWGPSTHASVFALQRAGSTFERLSVITDLGRGQQIYAVRHVGAVSYVVTFQRTDPLYVADFSDPSAPVLQGELHVPGYSTYLHPIALGRLLGIGQDATDDGRITGLQVSLFDVANPRDPRRLDMERLGGFSEAEYDHHAFLWWAPSGTLAIPVGNEHGFSVQVLRIVGNRIIRAGWIDGGDCPPRRTLVIGSELVVIGPSQVTVADMRSLRVRAAIETGPACNYYGV